MKKINLAIQMDGFSHPGSEALEIDFSLKLGVGDRTPHLRCGLGKQAYFH